ncbi:hypothetical protein GGI43DRAFT_419207 [Trichoderma evansii]
MLFPFHLCLPLASCLSKKIWFPAGEAAKVCVISVGSPPDYRIEGLVAGRQNTARTYIMRETPPDRWPLAPSGQILQNSTKDVLPV